MNVYAKQVGKAQIKLTRPADLPPCQEMKGKLIKD
jgi:hypothetical protein